MIYTISANNPNYWTDPTGKFARPPTPTPTPISDPHPYVQSFDAFATMLCWEEYMKFYQKHIDCLTTEGNKEGWNPHCVEAQVRFGVFFNCVKTRCNPCLETKLDTPASIIIKKKCCHDMRTACFAYCERMWPDNTAADSCKEDCNFWHAHCLKRWK